MNLNMVQLEEEIKHLEHSAEEFARHGMTEKVHSYQAAINILRKRLDRLEMNTIIELVEVEIQSLKDTVKFLHGRKLYDREECRKRELARHQHILDLLELEADKGLDR